MPTVKYHGFLFPPYSTIDLINRFQFVRPLTFYILDPLAGPELPYEELKTVPKEDLFVIVQHGEGHSHKEFDILLDILLNQVGVRPNHITLHTGCIYDPDSPVNSIGTIAPHCSITVEFTKNKFFNHVPTHHYVCLNRLPRWERQEIVETLLNRKLDIYGKISFASGLTAEQYHSQFSGSTSFPMYIDSVVSFDQGYQNTDVAITGAMFNIVTESAYEVSELRPGWEVNHSMPTLSEKTYKTFLTAQIPVLIAPYHTVTSARQFGFDMFDDIVDHGYDLEPDPIRRIQLVADQVERLCAIPLTQLQELKTQLAPRLQQNYDRMYYWAGNADGNRPRWQKYFSEAGILA